MSQTARFPRSEHRGLLLGLALPQLLLVGAALPMLALAAFAGAGTVPTIVLASLGGTLIAIASGRIEGQPLYRWIVLRSVLLARRTLQQTRFRARPERPSVAGTLALPGTAASLRVLASPAGVGVVHDPHSRTLTAVLRVAGTAFALLDSDEQDRRVTGWGRTLAGLCQGGRIARVHVLERTIPDSGDALAAYAEQHMADTECWPTQVYRELVNGASPASELHEMYLAVSLDLNRVRRQVRQAGGGLAGAAALLAQETVSIESSLQSAGLTPNGWLAVNEIAGVVRSAYDPEAFWQQPADEGSIGHAAGPVAVDERWDYLRTDTGFHAVYLIQEWPRVDVGADFLDPLLFMPGVRRSFSLIAQPVGVDRALKEIRRAKTRHVTDAQQRARIGQIEDEAMVAEYRDVLTREQDLVAGHGELRFVGLVTVTAATGEDLDRACGQAETAAVQAMVDLRRLVGQQAEGFVAAALPLGRGLR